MVAAGCRGDDLLGADLGDPLGAAFERHHAALLRLCALLSGDRGLAEDLVQDTFLRLRSHIADLSPEEVLPYARRIAVNLWKNRQRRLALERHVLPWLRAEPLPMISPEENEVLWSLIMQLPARQRACLVLRFYEDLTEREAAGVLGCSVGTVKSNTSRAIARLRREFHGH